MKKVFVFFFILIFGLGGYVYHEKYVFPSKQAEIMGDYVRIRQVPDVNTKNFHPTFRLMKGHQVKILERTLFDETIQNVGKTMTNHWYKIKNEEGHIGWVFGQYIKFIVPKSIPIASAKPLPPPPKLERPDIYSPALTPIDKVKNLLGDAYTKNFGTEREKDLIELVQACDYDNPLVRNTAVEVAGENASGYFNLGQVCNIFDYANKKWAYVNDPSLGEYVAKASESIATNHSGDCDDYAVLIASLVMAIGGEVNISYAYDHDSGHAFTEVKLGENYLRQQVEEYITIRYKINRVDGLVEDEAGNLWLNLDWSADYPGGPYYDYIGGTCFDVQREEMWSL